MEEPTTTNAIDYEQLYKQLKANQYKNQTNWRKNHRQQFNEMIKAYYHSKKDDPAFREKQREKAKRHYHKKKQERLNKAESESE